MNKVIIVSDSHGDKDELTRIRNRHKNEVDLFIHCGDSELSVEDDAITHFSTVRGNCDFEVRFPNERIENCGDYSFFVTHGHLYSVKSTFMNLFYRAKEVNAKIVCFGHSHILGAEVIEGVLFINPGSISLPRKRSEGTYVLLELEHGDATVKVFETEGEEMVDLRKEFSLPL